MPGDHTTHGRSLSVRQRASYFALVILLPLLGGPLAVNGSAVFQIIAIEELGLTSQQVGLAVGLGAVSIPFQILATRIPLRLAVRNLRLYLLAMSAMCLGIAWLMTGVGSVTFVTVAVIFLAVLAELAVSVLYATSFQPLLATTVAPRFRQQLNAQGRAAGGLLAVAFVILIGSTSTNGRIVVVVALAALGMLLVTAVNGLPGPLVGERRRANMEARTSADSDPDLRWILAAIGISVVPAWGFFVTYAADAFWPDASLGLVGAAIVVGALVAQAVWRPTERGLLRRARIGAVAMLVCALALVPLDAPVTGVIAELSAYGILACAMAAGTVVRMALLEMAHVRSEASTSVAILTRLDVVASTCMQLGFLAAGFLIERSVESTWIADPFQISLIVGGALLLASVMRIRDDGAIVTVV